MSYCVDCVFVMDFRKVTPQPVLVDYLGHLSLQLIINMPGRSVSVRLWMCGSSC